MIKLLLVEDDTNLCYIIRGGLEDMIGGYEVMTASNGEEGLRIWKEQHPDIIISDIDPGRRGFGAKRQAFRRKPPRREDGVTSARLRQAECLPSADIRAPEGKE